MAATKQTYTASATWTAAQLASIYRSAFIDAGLMTEWHDSFLSGSVENRVLRIQYDALKTYGTVFYWFMFQTNGVYLHVSNGWDIATDQPTGTQYLDYFSNATNLVNNHWSLSGALSSTTSANLFRYSSGSHHWFVSQQGTTRRVFTIQPPEFPLQSWLNLNLGSYSGIIYADSTSSGNGALVRFNRGPYLRRDLVYGTALRGSSDINSYTNLWSATGPLSLIAYAAPGNASNSASNNLGALLVTNAHASAIVLPVGFNNTNPAYVSDSSPVFHSMPFTPYCSTPLNSDFGITFHYATNVFGFQDKFIVTAGVEEWEVLSFANNATGNGTAASSAFLARIV